MAAVDLIRTFIAHVDAGEIDDAVALLADDVTLQSVFKAEPLHGREALRALLEADKAGWPEQRNEERSTIAQGDAVATEHRLTATTAAGRTASLDVLRIWDVAGGRIAAIRTYADTAPLLEALAG